MNCNLDQYREMVDPCQVLRMIMIIVPARCQAIHPPVLKCYNFREGGCMAWHLVGTIIIIIVSIGGWIYHILAFDLASVLY